MTQAPFYLLLLYKGGKNQTVEHDNVPAPKSPGLFCEEIFSNYNSNGGIDKSGSEKN